MAKKAKKSKSKKQMLSLKSILLMVFFLGMLLKMKGILINRAKYWFFKFRQHQNYPSNENGKAYANSIHRETFLKLFKRQDTNFYRYETSEKSSIHFKDGNPSDLYLNPNIELYDFGPKYGLGLKAMENIKHGDLLLRIPPHKYFSPKQIFYSYPRILFDPAKKFFDSALEPHDTHGMMDREVILAMHFLSRSKCIANIFSFNYNEHKKDELFHAYSDILPDDIPRLDTFNDNELKMIQDESLVRLAHFHKQKLVKLWSNGIEKVVQNMVYNNFMNLEVNIEGSEPSIKNISTCLNFSMFHKYVALIGSRIMVLKNNNKILVPLADMINFSPRDTQEMYPHKKFVDYHKLENKGTIAIYADRDVREGQQIFEEYSDVDNSLYLLMHGFVPDKNPSHCSILSTPRIKAAPDSYKVTKRVLDYLKIKFFEDEHVGVSPEIMPCVKNDGSLTDRKVQLFFSHMALMKHVDTNERHKMQRELCLDTAETLEESKFIDACIMFTGYEEKYFELMKEMALESLLKYPTTLENDLDLLKEYSEEENAPFTKNSAVISKRAKLALIFRLKDKEILRGVISQNSYPLKV